MTKPKNTPDPSPKPGEAKKPCTEVARGAVSVASKRKAEDLLTLRAGHHLKNLWSPFKIHRELKSILGDETIEITKLGSGDLMIELKLDDQAKKLGAIATYLDIPPKGGLPSNK
ncbi:hypothetical protein PoB_004601900 [Plakobranchus ocellatus]|uniref:Uncharacterized protein n=1 Tax=Plakobranchus ocellatus TaxID=259542 RepID=A0AAV4BMF8_9GAST|nr:hypothetical protein PoB_004601900 [Plakobranchus ocellatus]